VLLLPVMAAAARQPARPAPKGAFSHRQHLALKGVACATCHASAASSTATADDNRPPGEACLRCHEAGYEELARSGPAPVRGHRFNHELHLALGNLAPVLTDAIDQGGYLGDGAGVRALLQGADACGACHRGVKDVERPTAAQLPRMADCVVCHTAVDMPRSCGFCHTPEAVLLPASHDAGFGDRHSSRKLAKTDCKMCHGTRFTCMGCH